MTERDERAGGREWSPGMDAPCGHVEKVAGCGGCDPSAIEYEIDLRRPCVGLGVIWECDNCHLVVEIDNYDDEPAGWLVEEFDEDDYDEHEDIPDDLILCAGCYVPANVFRHYSPGVTQPATETRSSDD